MAHAPTVAFYQSRAICHKALGQQDAARVDEELARQTPPALAIDYYLNAVGFGAEDLGALEEGLRLEPRHFWLLMMFGECLMNGGFMGKGPEYDKAAAGVFTGCIMKRPEYAFAYSRRKNRRPMRNRGVAQRSDFRSQTSGVS